MINKILTFSANRSYNNYAFRNKDVQNEWLSILGGNFYVC